MQDGENIDRLIDLIKCKVDARALTDTVIMTNERHTACVKTAVEALELAIQNYYKITADCTAVDVRKAYSALAAVTGSDVNESIVDEIFSNFCVGK